MFEGISGEFLVYDLLLRGTPKQLRNSFRFDRGGCAHLLGRLPWTAPDAVTGHRIHDGYIHDQYNVAISMGIFNIYIYTYCSLYMYILDIPIHDIVHVHLVCR